MLYHPSGLSLVKQGTEALQSFWVIGLLGYWVITKFLSSVENEEDTQLLYDMVKKQSDPPESWEMYSITILGDAAVEKLKRLEVDRHAFRLESWKNDRIITAGVQKTELLNEQAELDSIVTLST